MSSECKPWIELTPTYWLTFKLKNFTRVKSIKVYSLHFIDLIKVRPNWTFQIPILAMITKMNLAARKWSNHEIIHHVWLSIRLNNFIAGHKTNWKKNLWNWSKLVLFLFLSILGSKNVKLLIHLNLTHIGRSQNISWHLSGCVFKEQQLAPILSNVFLLFNCKKHAWYKICSLFKFYNYWYQINSTSGC